jgi:hypothetical protein
MPYVELLTPTNAFADRSADDGTKIVVPRDAYDRSDTGRLWAKTARMLSFWHRNSVSLRAISIHGKQCWFVYENKLPGVNGSLDAWLEQHAAQKPLDMASRCYRVVLGVACGLQYLHEQEAVFAVTMEKHRARCDARADDRRRSDRGR